MNIVIHAKGFSCTPAIREFTERRLTRAIYRYKTEISQVNVYLDDVNGADKGGVDKHVVVRISLQNCPVAVVEAVSSDLYDAIALAVVRSRTMVKRDLRRQQQLERKEARKLRTSFLGRSDAEFA